MRFSFGIVALSLAKSTWASWSPPRLDYRNVIATDDSNAQIIVREILTSSLLEARTSQGVLSLTHVFPEEVKKGMLQAMMECYDREPSDYGSKSIVYPDGTKRSTWSAGVSKSVRSSVTSSCEGLAEKMEPIRALVDEAMANLADEMGQALNQGGQDVVFSTDSESDEYGFQDLVEEGEQLDHFHVYDASLASAHDVTKTLEWHTDFGWALAFLPGQLIASKEHENVEFTPSKGFYIKLSDGSEEQVSFSSEDDLVILLGDGVNHINQALQTRDSDSEHDRLRLRSVPHAFAMSENESALRFWYGRMMLFPSNVLHPTLNQSFGTIRKSMNSDPNYYTNLVDTGYALGCSRPEDLSPRLLAEDGTNCDEDQFNCWHSCFNHTEEVSPTVCEGRQLEMACVDTVTLEADGSVVLWDGATHGKQFAPECVDMEGATVYTPPTEAVTVDAGEGEDLAGNETMVDHEGEDLAGNETMVDHEGEDLAGNETMVDHEGEDHAANDTATDGAEDADLDHDGDDHTGHDHGDETTEEGEPLTGESNGSFAFKHHVVFASYAAIVVGFLSVIV